MKTVSDEEKTAAAERIFRKTFKKKENNAADTEENTEAFKSAHH